MPIYWGETHDNTYQFGQQIPPLDEICQLARGHLDFYSSAYYTAHADAFVRGGHPADIAVTERRLILERVKPFEQLQREWDEVRRIINAADEPGRFVALPGYEWQGNGCWGDFNVMHLDTHVPITHAMTLPALYDHIRPHRVIAIPHHTGYRVGRRAPRWADVDEALSPASEIYSIHGCSEVDEDFIGLRHNSHMGPGIGGGMWQDALNLGLHIGAICSNDNWDIMPGRYNWGLAACIAPELTREAIFQAFKRRQVYGVTGDRIELNFSVNDTPMGSIISAQDTRRIRVHVVGCDVLDRIEVMRGPRVIATYNHQRTWEELAGRSRFKLRIEAGWGPHLNELPCPEDAEHDWAGELEVSNGTVLRSQPCWISPAQTQPQIRGRRATFTMRTRAKDEGCERQNANVFEIDAEPSAVVRVRMNDMIYDATLADLMRTSRVMWNRDEAVRLLHEFFALTPDSHERDDPYYCLAWKVKLHRVVPEADYTASFEFEDDELLDAETHYRVRIQQRNGQMAWSSPIWVRPT